MQVTNPSNVHIELEESSAQPPLSEEELSEDLYQQMKELEEEIEFIDIQENFIKVEQQNLKRELLRAKEELKRIQSVPLVIGQFIEMIDEIYGLVSTTSGTTYMVSLDYYLILGESAFNFGQRKAEAKLHCGFAQIIAFCCGYPPQ